MNQVILHNMIRAILPRDCGDYLAKGINNINYYPGVTVACMPVNTKKTLTSEPNPGYNGEQCRIKYNRMYGQNRSIQYY
jgi:hypothetical protein